MAKTKTNTRWTEKEIQYLQQNANLSIAQLAKNLNRTESSVASKKYALKDDGNLPHVKTAWSQNEIDYLAQHIDDSNEELIPFLKRSAKDINAMRHNIKNGKVRFAKPGAKAPAKKPATKASTPAKTNVVKKPLNEYKAGDIIPAVDALLIAEKVGKTPYLLLRNNEAITFLPDGDKDLGRLEADGQLQLGDAIFEIRKKYSIGIKKI